MFIIVCTSGLVKFAFVDDLTSYMVFSLSFMPNCGHKYFLAAVDDGIKLFDFEAEKVLWFIMELYSYSSCVVLFF